MDETFPISSRAKVTMMLFITRYINAGSLYYTDDRFAYTFLPIKGNHVAVVKDKGLPKGRNHWKGKEIEWQFNHRNENLVVLLHKLLNQQI